MAKAVNTNRPAEAAAAGTRKYRPEVDGLRALAVLPIVLFHAGFDWLPGGYIGVDIFFVISGYLLGRIVSHDIAEGRFSIARFYRHRARRILPAMLILLTVTLGAGYFVLLPGEMVQLAQATAAVLLFVPNIYFWDASTTYFGMDIATEPLLHTWSLGVEEQFYLFLPALLLLCARMRGQRAPQIFLCTLIAASFLVNISLMSVDSKFSFYMLPARAWELLTGVILGLHAVRIRPGQLWPQLLAVTGLLLCVLPLFMLSEASAFPGSNALYPVLGSAAIIAATGAGTTWVGRLLSLWPMVAIGRISYSLYLWHWPVVVYVNLAWPEGAYNAWLAAGLSLPLAWLSYTLVESRYRRQPFREHTVREPARLRELGWGAAVVVSLCGLTVVAGGLPSRIPASAWAVAGEPALPERYAACEPFATDSGLDATICHLGNPDRDPVFALWGDSHANALGPGMHHAAAALDTAGLLFFGSGCPALLEVNRAANTECSEFNREVSSFLQDRGDINLVYLAGYWAVPFTGQGYDKGFHLIEDAQTRYRSAGENELVFARGLSRTINAMQGRDIVIVEDVPEVGWRFGKQVSNHFVRQAWLANEPYEEPVFTLDDNPVNERFDQLLASYHNRASVLRILPALCTGSECPLQINDRLVYRDGDHLSDFGSKILTPLLIRSLSGYIGSAAGGDS